MAFSFRAGTNWCHDFPKLARESGFHFNMHKSKVRVDWNRISSIDVERVIRERDFWIVDENVNNVIDYSLESEYDVKILDPNFVKLFRLAQLAVEYLLYCKQYLDHSVVILKDELKSKIEENSKLKKQINESDDTIARLKEKTRDRNRLIEARNTDSTGEIHKCPHCPKTFVSAIFVTAHIARRHHYLSGLEASSPPIHENYRAQTEKLNNEIKALKERLNQTEKVIQNESKISDRSKLHPESSKSDLEKTDELAKYKSYHEDICNLKNMLFDEIRNLRQRSVYNDQSSEISVQTLLSQQEKEFQKLRNQLLERLTPDIECLQSKLHSQEDSWKSKLEHVESEHRKDTERLHAELQLMQEMSNRIKLDYESKINDLEQQTAKQSNILLEQSKQLKKLSNELSHSQSEFLSNYQEHSVRRTTPTRQITTERENSISSIDSARRVIPVTPRIENLSRIANDKTVCKKVKQVKPVRDIGEGSDSEDAEDREEQGKAFGQSSLRTNRCSTDSPLTNSSNTGNNEIQTVNTKNDGKIKVRSYDTNPDEVDTTDSSDTKSESVTKSSQSEYESEFERMIRAKQKPIHNEMPETLPKPKAIKQIPTDRATLQMQLQETIQQKLRDLGIDPEWQGLPYSTFKQKMEIIKHHGKIRAKKLPKYNQTKLKLIEEVRNKLSTKRRRKMSNKSLKQRSLEQLVPSVQAKAINAVGSRRDMFSTTSKLENAETIRPQERVRERQLISDTNEKSNKARVNNRVTYVSQKANSYAKDSAESTPKSAGSRASSTNESKQRLVSSHIEGVNESVDIYQSFVNQVENTLDKSILPSDEAQLGSTSTPMTKQSFLVRPAAHRGHSASRSHEEIIQNFLNSPKSNKSVLKSASGSTSSLVKKKVNFDLKDEQFEDLESASGEEERADYQEPEARSASGSNIVLKTSQSSKIAEISRKIEEQLSMTRHQPAGSVETIFVSQEVQEKLNNDYRVEQANTPKIESLPLESPLPSSRDYNNSLPRPAPRNVQEKTFEIVSYDTDDFELNSDIDEILKTE